MKVTEDGREMYVQPKYILIFKEQGRQRYEVLDYKPEVRKKIQEIGKDAVVAIFRGKAVPFKIQERVEF